MYLFKTFIIANYVNFYWVNNIVLLNGYFHIKPVLYPRQSYWVEVSYIGLRQCRGPIQLIEAQYDCTRTYIWKYPFYDTFINQWLKITVFFLIFRCGHNYTADQDLIWQHDDLIQDLLILTGPYITYWQSKKSLIFILHMFFNIII